MPPKKIVIGKEKVKKADVDVNSDDIEKDTTNESIILKFQN